MNSDREVGQAWVWLTLAAVLAIGCNPLTLPFLLLHGDPKIPAEYPLRPKDKDAAKHDKDEEITVLVLCPHAQQHHVRVRRGGPRTASMIAKQAARGGEGVQGQGGRWSSRRQVDKFKMANPNWKYMPAVADRQEAQGRLRAGNQPREREPVPARQREPGVRGAGRGRGGRVRRGRRGRRAEAPVHPPVQLPEDRADRRRATCRSAGSRWSSWSSSPRNWCSSTWSTSSGRRSPAGGAVGWAGGRWRKTRPVGANRGPAGRSRWVVVATGPAE